jgi:hypothetical protein
MESLLAAALGLLALGAGAAETSVPMAIAGADEAGAPIGSVRIVEPRWPAA